MRTNSGADYAPVRGLTRGLDLLRALNSQEGGRSTLAQLAQATGLHRTTVRRLLETLIAEGYVRRSESDDRYCLALRVRSLAEGFRDEDWISSIAAPALSELLQSVVWPSDLTTPQGAHMVIRESTHRFSPLSFHRAMVGQSLPMLLTAAGRAFFSHCQDEQREQVTTSRPAWPPTTASSPSSSPAPSKEASPATTANGHPRARSGPWPCPSCSRTSPWASSISFT